MTASRDLSQRERLILAGLFLSKFDTQGLEKLGFVTFREAYNAIAYAVGGRPASVKNYRDEFDPYFENPRSGWRNREIRHYCKHILDEFGDLDLETLSALVTSAIGAACAPADQTETGDVSSFATRLITGRAAERYFQTHYSMIPDFAECELFDTTCLGCGFDFRLCPANSDQFLAVEVKGIRGNSGGLMMTNKEFEMAKQLRTRFYLFVAKAFDEIPLH